jgi:hypothetical protein
VASRYTLTNVNTAPSWVRGQYEVRLVGLYQKLFSGLLHLSSAYRARPSSVLSPYAHDVNICRLRTIRDVRSLTAD